MYLFYYIDEYHELSTENKTLMFSIELWLTDNVKTIS